jgi:hypothetical protein
MGDINWRGGDIGVMDVTLSGAGLGDSQARHLKLKDSSRGDKRGES